MNPSQIYGLKSLRAFLRFHPWSLRRVKSALGTYLSLFPRLGDTEMAFEGVWRLLVLWNGRLPLFFVHSHDYQRKSVAE